MPAGGNGDRRAHWIRPNHANRYPRRLVTLDSEAKIDYNGRRERHRFRLAYAVRDAIDRSTLEPAKSEAAAFLDTAELWAWIDEWTRVNERTVVWAHNLGYDLRVTRALEELPRLGYEPTGMALDAYRCWMRWKRGRRSLVLVDLQSFLPVPLSTVARSIGRRRSPLPEQDEPDTRWLERCRVDAEVTREAVLRMLRWLERSDLGSWRLTGPAQGTAAFRHRFMQSESLLVHDHSPALAAERRSAWSGRCEVWRHGVIPGYLFEWDYRLAYAHVARTAELPVRFVGTKYAVTPADLERLRERFAVLAEVEVETPTETVPTEIDGKIAWPVGRFDTTLWDVELDLLVAGGGTYRIRRAYLYDRAPALKPWAEWVIGALDGHEPERDELARIMLKAWSRSTIGRFGLRYPMLHRIATSDTSTIEWRPHLRADVRELGYTVQVGKDVLEHAGDAEGRDSMPAVMAYVMALSRCRLWRAMRAIGLEHVAYVDTDSLVVDGAGHTAARELTQDPEHVGLRFKRRHHGVELLAPRVVLTAEGPKVAGLPKNARAQGNRRYVAEVWESTSTAMRRRRPGEVVVTRRLYTLTAKDSRRRHLKDGRTEPLTVHTGDSSRLTVG